MIPSTPALPPPSLDRRLEVAEFQGLYGAYHVSELLLQKIWLRGAFDQARARTTFGETVTVLHPGAWNRLSGPDFREARLLMGGREITGDIEVHFHADAWRQHGHDADPAYAKVALHVVLFPPAPGAPAACTHDGRAIPVLVLVDLLWHDLEEYAADEAVAALSGRDAIPLVEHLLAMDPATRADAVRTAADARWHQKVRYARLRAERCGWEEACHLTALEILGYRANREAMLRVGTRHPWATWSRPDAAAAPTIEALLDAAAGAWTLRGVRPANQPKLRLAQYSRWMSAIPDWPQRLREWSLPAITEPADNDETVTRLRRRTRLAALRAELSRALTGDAVGGVRFDTLVINLVLPFLAAVDDGRSSAAAAWWRLWTPGDVAEVLLEASRRLGPTDSRGHRTNASVQGLLGLHLQHSLPTALID